MSGGAAGESGSGGEAGQSSVNDAGTERDAGEGRDAGEDRERDAGETTSGRTRGGIVGGSRCAVVNPGTAADSGQGWLAAGPMLVLLFVSRRRGRAKQLQRD
jgi:hypothetical protein